VVLKRLIAYALTILSGLVMALIAMPTAAQANPDYLLNRQWAFCVVNQHTFSVQVQTSVYYDIQFREPHIESPNVYGRAWECSNQNQSKVMQSISVWMDLVGTGWGLDGCATGYPAGFTCTFGGEEHKLSLNAGPRGNVASHYASYVGQITSIKAGSWGRVQQVSLNGTAGFQPHGSVSTYFYAASATSHND
jgi:hypothetical protein